MGSPVALAGTGVVTLLAFAVSGASYRAMLRTGNRAVGFVALAFLLLGAKSAVKASYLLRDVAVPTGTEILFTLADVAMVALIAWPLLARRRG
jgi:hypothetical protein